LVPKWVPAFPILILRNAVACKGTLAIYTVQWAPGGALKMLDIIMLGLGLGFFALSVGYTYACDQL